MNLGPFQCSLAISTFSAWGVIGVGDALGRLGRPLDAMGADLQQIGDAGPGSAGHLGR